MAYRVLETPQPYCGEHGLCAGEGRVPETGANIISTPAPPHTFLQFPRAATHKPSTTSTNDTHPLSHSHTLSPIHPLLEPCIDCLAFGPLISYPPAQALFPISFFFPPPF